MRDRPFVFALKRAALVFVAVTSAPALARRSAAVCACTSLSLSMKEPAVSCVINRASRQEFVRIRVDMRELASLTRGWFDAKFWELGYLAERFDWMSAAFMSLSVAPRSARSTLAQCSCPSHGMTIPSRATRSAQSCWLSSCSSS